MKGRVARPWTQKKNNIDNYVKKMEKNFNGTFIFVYYLRWHNESIIT